MLLIYDLLGGSLSTYLAASSFTVYFDLDWLIFQSQKWGKLSFAQTSVFYANMLKLTFWNLSFDYISIDLQFCTLCKLKIISI